MHLKNIRLILAVAVTALLVLPLAAFAEDVVKVTNYGDALYFEPAIEAEDFILDVTGPCNYKLRRTLSEDRELFFQLDETTIDGRYRFEVKAIPYISSDIKKTLQKARLSGDGTEDQLCRDGKLPGIPQVEHAGFGVIKGEIVYDEKSSEEKVASLEKADDGQQPGMNPVAATLLGGQSMTLDPEALEKQVISGDLVVYNSICVGFDCPTNPTFGADTIRMQENNLRIHVDDTSTAGSYPNTDWRLEFNSQINGGGGYFRVIDASANRNVMTVEAGAPSNSLYVENSGEVGIGTANPVLELHAVDGDTPGLRLEQDTSSGFGAQVWDLAGNETSFFVRDATNGSTLPFRVFPGSASSSLVVRDSEVGVGTLSPADKLHVFKSSGGTNIRVESGDAGAGFRLKGNGHEGQIFMASDGDLRIRGLTGSGEITIDTANGFVGINDTTPSGTLDVNGTIYLSGSQIHPDYVFESSYELPSIEEQSAFMWENKHLPAVAPAKYNEDGKRVIELGANTAGILEELEKAHIYIEQLNAKLKAEEETNSELANRLQRLEALLLDQE